MEDTTLMAALWNLSLILKRILWQEGYHPNR